MNHAFGRVVDHLWYAYAASADPDRYTYAYDRASNRLYRENTLTTSRDELYGYDQVNRLVEFARGDLNNPKSAIENPNSAEDWSLDMTGNWPGFVQKTSGDAVERYVYSPYSVVTIYDATWTSTRNVSSYANVTLYIGRELDAETGLYYYRNRYHSAECGRSVSREPIGYEGSKWNLYKYVRSSPLAHTDPNGLFLLWLLRCLGFAEKISDLTGCKRFVERLGQFQDECADEYDSAPSKINWLIAYQVKCLDRILPTINVNDARHPVLCCILLKAKDDPYVDLDDFEDGYAKCFRAMVMPVWTPRPDFRTPIQTLR